MEKARKKEEKKRKRGHLGAVAILLEDPTPKRWALFIKREQTNNLQEFVGFVSLLEFLLCIWFLAFIRMPLQTNCLLVCLFVCCSFCLFVLFVHVCLVCWLVLLVLCLFCLVLLVFSVCFFFGLILWCLTRSANLRYAFFTSEEDAPKVSPRDVLWCVEQKQSHKKCRERESEEEEEGLSDNKICSKILSKN